MGGWAASEAGGLQALLTCAEQVAEMGSWEYVPSKAELVWSANLFRIFGLEPDEVAPTLDRVLTHTHPDDRDRVAAAVQGLEKHGELHALDYRIIRPDGERRHVRATLAVIEDSFGLQAGTRIALVETYCQRVVEGRLANLVADAQSDPCVADLTPRLGAYVGVPVTFSDGRQYGTLCCASHAPAPWLRDRDIAFLRVLGRMLAHELERAEVEREARHHRNEAIALGALFAALDARDSYTGRHSDAVVELSVRVTRELGLPESFVDEVKQVALLHDIGKIGIPDAILSKQGPLNAAEWELMHMHPVIGARIVASIETLAAAIRAEHERCDGNGYPDGLKRDEIPLASRITFACDAYDAMLSTRPYRPAMNGPAAQAELRKHAGT